MKKISQKRFEDLGYSVGEFPRGPSNSITDVSGVQVGFKTLNQKKGQCTGVTAILPSKKIFEYRYPAGFYSLNGAGEVTGSRQIQEWGLLESPILLTNTHGVGAAWNGCLDWLRAKYAGLGEKWGVALPVVGECDDSKINHDRSFGIQSMDAVHALQSASGTVIEGNSGGGAGLMTGGFKSGTGTSSRSIKTKSKTFRLGILLQSNWGLSRDLRILGIRLKDLGLESSHSEDKPLQEGSIVGVIATDAPLSSPQLERLAKRAALGVARCGSTGRHASGEMFLAFSTAQGQKWNDSQSPQRSSLPDSALNLFFEATCDMAEEAVYNSLLMSEEAITWSGKKVAALDAHQLKEKLDSIFRGTKNRNEAPEHQKVRRKNLSKK